MYMHIQRNFNGQTNINGQTQQISLNNEVFKLKNCIRKKSNLRRIRGATSGAEMSVQIKGHGGSGSKGARRCHNQLATQFNVTVMIINTYPLKARQK